MPPPAQRRSIFQGFRKTPSHLDLGEKSPLIEFDGRCLCLHWNDADEPCGTLSKGDRCCPRNTPEGSRAAGYLAPGCIIPCAKVLPQEAAHGHLRNALRHAGSEESIAQEE